MVMSKAGSTRSDWRGRAAAKQTSAGSRWSRRVVLTLLVAGLAGRAGLDLMAGQLSRHAVVVISMGHYDAIVPQRRGPGRRGALKQSWSEDHVRLVREPRLGTYAGMPRWQITWASVGTTP